MSRRRTKHEEPEEHENHERWLVTYADMVTLLMVLFIVMFAMSAVDQEKYNALKSGLATGFGQDSILNGNESVLADDNSPITTINPQLANASLSEKERAAVDGALQEQNRMAAERSRDDAAAEVERLDEVYERIRAALRERGLEDDVQASYDERGLVVSLVSKHVVFEADLATLSDRGRLVVDTMAPVLRELADPLQVDGHTNQASGKPRFFDTDWDLSAARAIAVLRRLDEHLGVPAERLSLAAYGHERPLVDPAEAGSQAINKRVDIVVLSNAPADARALLAEVAREKRAAGFHDSPETQTQTTSSQTADGSTEAAPAPETSPEGPHR
ncbi:OmpA/MotB family protein [Nocardioides dongkuii]|uniref:OmpA/MotB family protein n=1 Tax=Nocardioides dongkuii TaxID=2760089 RepID=UPI0015F89E70|nr:flagellar motor protein MotB [Nocardioides dongkuii]